VADRRLDSAGNAVSPKGATGAWQFMPGTAARYGLKRNVWGDERTDLDKSTVVAAHYLADLHRLFGHWALALAAYNAGQDRVLEAVAKGKTRDFWRLSEQGLFPGETQEYVPKVLAAARAWKAVLPDPAAGRPGNALAPSSGRRQERVYALSSNDLAVDSAVVVPKLGGLPQETRSPQTSEQHHQGKEVL
jgi:hypothetical protein